MTAKPEATIDDVMSLLSKFANDTGEDFAKIDLRFDRLEGRVDTIETNVVEMKTTLTEHGHMLREHSQTLREHGNMLREHGQTLREHGNMLRNLQATVDQIADTQEAHGNDIAEIYGILKKVENKQKVSDKELQRTQEKLQAIVSWAVHAANKLDIPLKLS